MGWTKAQQKVIDARNKNILVSAAAGSGKTAVLVERIITMISEGDTPMDIDHLLVVTFTNAAAAEMRERIGKAIDKKLQENPDNLHLQRQISLLQSAQITTIHSFCLNVIRNYFHRIDLDPSFKIAEDAEITLMKSDVIAEILERWYEEGREDFHDFVESYSHSKSDLPLEELILQLHGFSMSDPWPMAWIARMRQNFVVTSVEEMKDTNWMKELLEYVKAVLKDLEKKNSQALSICQEANGPMAYEAALLSDRSILEALRTAETYEEYAKLFPVISYDRLSNKKDENVLPWKKEEVKSLREEVKKGIKELTGQYFFQPPEDMVADLQAVGKIMQVLFDLTLEFMEEFSKKKEEKNLIDFNDLEHFALKILVKEEEGGESSPTEAALELSEQFEEILIDEYQDSNMVQETLLRSISREDRGRPNRFMVGDVKQSIYKFRLAMPEIFMKKYSSYSCEDVNSEGELNYYQRIDLDKNFRSRDIVLQYVNRIFEQIMQSSVGGIVYDEAASLKYGELYEEILIEQKSLGLENDKAAMIGVTEDLLPKQEAIENLLSEEIRSRIAQEVEFLLVTEESDEEESYASFEEPALDAINRSDENEEEAVYTKKELEARALARRIKELTNPDTGMLVFDQKAKIHRTASLRDIVILLRSMTGWSEVFVNTLMQEGIPAYADTGTGYFQTVEIMTILNMLHIIDNPRQDIPLVGVLYSPMVGLTTTELALIRAYDRNVDMYSALLTFAEYNKEDELQKATLTEEKLVDVQVEEEGLVKKEGIEANDELKIKVKRFLQKLDYYRSLVNHKPIHEIIQLVLDDTGYYYYANAMPGGEQRQANIDMLISRAVRFEKGSYSGLFHFIRYIEKLRKYEVDFGEAAISGEQDNTVRIMSIHKSKGLEFPIVIVAAMGKQFNMQDQRSSIVLHSEFGVGPEYIDSKLRTKVPTLMKKVIQKKVQVENLGEELRVLYVAMTRAKEKLILSGYLKSKDEIKGKEFSFFELLSAKSYMDWVLPAMVNHMGCQPENELGQRYWKKGDMLVTILSKAELLQNEITKQLFFQKDIQELEGLEADKIYDSKMKEEIKSRFNYCYPYRKEADIKVKMTVSELKKLGQFQDEEQSVKLHPSDPKYDNRETSQPVVTVPNFLRQEEEITGTDRGTLYHKVLELIDLTRVRTREELLLELELLASTNKLIDEDIKKLKLDYIYNFISSDIATRMRRAQNENKVYKERQFVMGIRASEVLPDTDSKELILIQGIIDVFFEEGGEFVLLDYKSDLVKDEKQLIHRYKVQLQYYKRALEQMLNTPVKEMILYSLPLGREIRIEE